MTNRLDIFTLIKSIIKHHKFIITFVVIISILAVIISIIYPKFWKSTAVIAVTSNSAAFPGVLSSLLSNYSSNLASLAGNGEADLQLEILNSREFYEKTIQHFNLREYFKVKENRWKIDSLNVMDSCVNQLQNDVIRVSANEVTGTITISATTKDRVLSKKIVEFLVEELDKYNKEIKISKGKEKRLFLEKRMLQVEDDIDNQSEELAAFQQKNHLINLDEQVSAAIGAFSEMVKEKVKTVTELEFVISYMSKDNPKVMEYKKRLESINAQLDRMQNDNFSKYIPNFEDVNGLTLVYMKKKLKLEISSQVYETLLPQYELAKLEEINDLTSIQYIQRASLDGIREKPKRAAICIVAFLLSLVFACLASLLYDLLIVYKPLFIEVLRPDTE